MSNTQQITDALKDLILNDDRAFVGMLSGEWGIGKTYFWEKKFVPDHLEDKKVVYVSLFGQNTLQDIETTIVTKLYKYNKNLKKYTRHLDTIGNLGSKALGLSANISIGSLLSLFTPNDFKNIVICFDDFERLSDKIPLKDVMGLISQFKERKKCKIVMILNEKELDNLSDIDGKRHSDIFSLYKEKIVDYNFHYNPSQEELFEATEQDIEKIKFCDHETIYNFFRKIDLRNIRIMKQSLYLLEQFSFIGNKNYDKQVVDEFVEIALNLFVFKAKSNYTYSEFKNMHSYMYTKILESQMEDKVSTVDESTKLNAKHEKNYQYYYSQNDHTQKQYQSRNKGIVEKIIYKFLDNHILDRQELKKQLNDNNQHKDYYKKREEVSKLHHRFWTDFSSSNEEIAKHLLEILTKYKDDMHRLFHYSDYKPLIKNINKFAPGLSTEKLEEDIAKKCLEFYIMSPNHDKYGPLEDESQTDLIFSDYEWAEEYYSEQKKQLLTIDPNDALVLISQTLESRYLSEDNAYKLNQISAKDYEKLIKETPDFIQPLVRFLKMHDSKDVRGNIIDALLSLKKQNNDYEWKVNQIFKSANIKIEEQKQ